MNEQERVRSVTDKFEIVEVSTIAMVCRDTGDWARLAHCFHPDARLTTSWFDGTAREFAEQSKNMMEGHHPGDTQRHMMSNPRVTLNGRRAINEFYLVLHQGRTLDGYEFDFLTWSVTLDLFEKRDGGWRISKRTMIYEKGRMDPRTPGSVPSRDRASVRPAISAASKALCSSGRSRRRRATGPSRWSWKGAFMRRSGDSWCCP